MDLLERLVRDVLERVRLVPAVGEDVEGDLAADRVGEPVRAEFRLERLDEGGADAVDLRRKGVGVSGCGPGRCVREGDTLS